MTLQFPLKFNHTLIMVSAYDPTMTNSDDVKDNFYLNTIVCFIPWSNKLLILGDFNTRVGQDHTTWENVIGHHGIGKSNNNGLLLNLCASHELLITNTVFRLPNRNKTSWMHPRSKHWHLIDYVITTVRPTALVL